MAFPNTAVPVTVEIAPGGDPAADPGTWAFTDITDQVRLADGIQIVQGRQNEASLIDPSRCTMRLDNSSGDFTPRNPNGQWYGTLGRNTPLRVSVRAAEDAFARTSSNGWGTADSGQLWSGYGAGGSVNGTDFFISGGKASQSVPTTGAYRTAWLPDLSVLDVRVRLSGVSLPFTDVTGGSVEPGNILLRAQSLTEYYMARVEITATEAVVCKLYNPAGTLLASATVSGLVHASSQSLDVLAEIVGNRLSMKVWATGGTEPAGWAVTAADDSLDLPGGIGVRTGVASGNTNTLPVVASYESITVYADRFAGFVSSWPPRWDKSGNDATVPIQADGVLRRLGKGSPPSRSPLRRTIAATSPVAYWPGEDGSLTTAAGSALPGGGPMVISGSVTFSSATTYNADTVRYGTSALGDLAGGGSLSANLSGEAITATGSAWTVHVFGQFDVASSSGDIVLMEWITPGGTYSRWQLVENKTTLHTQVIAYTTAGSSTVVVDRNGVLGGFRTWVVSAQQNGGNIDVTYRVAAAETYTGSVAGTLAGVASMKVNASGTTSTEPMPFGHLAVWASATLPYGTDAFLDSYGAVVLPAYASYAGEAATDRLDRLCAEDSAQLSIPSVSADSVTWMDWQPASTPLDLYRQCETADQGVLYELGFGLGYLPRSARYNRPTTLGLDFDAGQVADPPEPIDDDQALLNRVTVRRTDGSSAVAEDADSIAAVGTYEGSVDVNLASDEPLANHASWRVHVGASDVMRWPQINVNLARSPELIDAVLSCRVQSRMVVDNPPTQATGDDIDVLIEGYSETIGFKDWLVSFNTSPAQVWDVATADGDQRVAADGTTLSAAISASDTVIAMAHTTANGPWTSDPNDYPLNIRVGGEKVRTDAPGNVLNANPWFLSGVANWNGSGCTLAPTTGRPGTTWAGALVTPDGVTAVGNVTSDPVIVAASLDHRFMLWAKANTAAVSISIAADWQTAAGAAISSSFGTVVTLTPGLWTPLSATFTSPATAGKVIMRQRFEGTPPASATWTISGFTLATEATTTGVGAFQRLTCAPGGRALNGVSRSWPAGTEVDVWTPAIVPL